MAPLQDGAGLLHIEKRCLCVVAGIGGGQPSVNISKYHSATIIWLSVMSWFESLKKNWSELMKMVRILDLGNSNGQKSPKLTPSSAK